MILLWILALVTVLWLVNSCIRPLNYPPGPAFLPLLGNLIYYKKLHKVLGFHHLTWLEICKKYGPVIGLKLGKNYIVSVAGSEAVKEVLSREDFDGRPDGFFFKLRTFGKRLGILFIDGQMWKKQRKFSLHHLRNFGFGRKAMEEKIHIECEALVKHLRENCGKPVFMHNAFAIYVLNALWAMIAGQRFDDNDERLKKLLNIIYDSFRIIDISGGLIDQVPFLRHIAPSAIGYNQVMDVLNQMWTFMKETVDEHRQNAVFQPRDLIDAFLHSMEIKVDNSFTNDQLLSLCLDLFMAGSETNSHSLGFAVMYMTVYPEIQKKVQKEMDDIVGRNRWPSLSDKINLKYTEAVLLELLRVVNIGPLGITHRATKDTKLMGYNIAEGTLILANLYSVHMDEKIWKDPHAFRPERFLDAEGKIYYNEDHYMPFGLGRRRCLGEILAKTNLFLFFTAVMHNFNFEAVPEWYPDLTPTDGVTLAPRPFKARITRRDTEAMWTEVLFTILCLFLIVWWVCEGSIHKFPPGPSWKPLIGNGPELRQLAQTLGGQHLAFIELAKRYDTEVVGLKLGKERVICACSYSTVKQVLTSDEYLNRPVNFFMELRTMGTKKGITGADGELWKEQRSFLVSHLRALGFGKSEMEQMVKKEIRETITLIEKNKDGMSVSKTLAPSVLNILWTLTSGSKLKGNNLIERLIELLNKRTIAFDISGGTLNNYPWLRFIAPEKTGYNIMQTVNNEIREFIMEAIKIHQNSWTEGRCDDFIYAFLTEMKRKEKNLGFFSEEQLMMVCLDIFIAGSASTSSTIDFAFLAMILYPEVQEKVFLCLDSEFRRKEDLSYCDKQRVPYIEAVLLECQRFFPVVPIIGPRRNLRQTHLDEYIIPKNTTVLINLHSVHHDKQFWKDPDRFRPERFLDRSGNLVNQDRVLTFGLGKRRCLGDALAKTCIFLFFVEILRKYKIEYEGECIPTGKQVPGILLSTEKYIAKFIPRYAH
ncbi:uncharacterized protein [Euwallacea similis]|uniref:uncharacterized protein n=1 Tax=Euwallacea similis TaxID=1736056 RepID=UPI00344BC718